MGQRSQIYVRFNGKLIVANYYSWNYSERMISRARHGIEYIKDYEDYIYSQLTDHTGIIKLRRYFDVNFDMKDIAISANIIKEYLEYGYGESLPEYIFTDYCNNNGQLLIDVFARKDEEPVIKYAFIHYGESDLDYDNPLTPADYMKKDCGESWKDKLDVNDKNICVNNINYIMENAELMTVEEIQEFITNTDMYVYDLDYSLIGKLLHFEHDIFGYKLYLGKEVIYSFKEIKPTDTAKSFYNSILLDLKHKYSEWGKYYRLVAANEEIIKNLLIDENLVEE